MAVEAQQDLTFNKGGALVKKKRTGSDGCTEVDDWTTTNMEYGNFYQLLLHSLTTTAAGAGADKPDAQMNGDGGDIHAECKRELAIARKELEDCRAQLQQLTNGSPAAAVTATNDGAITDSPADQAAMPERISRARHYRKLAGHNASRKTAATTGAVRVGDDDKIKPLYQVEFGKLRLRMSAPPDRRGVQHRHHQLAAAVKSHPADLQDKRKSMRSSSSSSSLKGVNNNMWKRQTSSSTTMAHF